MYSVGNFWMKIKTWFISKNCLFLFWKSVYFLVKNKPIFRINKISFKSHQYSNHSWLIFILTIDLVNIPPVFQRAKIEKEYSLSLVVLNWRLNSYKKIYCRLCWILQINYWFLVEKHNQIYFCIWYPPEGKH